MRSLLTLAFVAILAGPAWAGERTPLSEYLDTYRLPANERAKFDHALNTAFDTNCDCFRFILSEDTSESRKGDIVKVGVPKNDGDRRLIIEFIRRGLWIPMDIAGQGS